MAWARRRRDGWMGPLGAPRRVSTGPTACHGQGATDGVRPAERAARERSRKHHQGGTPRTSGGPLGGRVTVTFRYHRCGGLFAGLWRSEGRKRPASQGSRTVIHRFLQACGSGEAQFCHSSTAVHTAVETGGSGCPQVNPQVGKTKGWSHILVHRCGHRLVCRVLHRCECPAGDLVVFGPPYPRNIGGNRCVGGPLFVRDSIASHISTPPTSDLQRRPSTARASLGPLDTPVIPCETVTTCPPGPHGAPVVKAPGAAGAALGCRCFPPHRAARAEEHGRAQTGTRQQTSRTGSGTLAAALSSSSR